MGGAVVIEACSETVGAVKAGMETGSVSLRSVVNPNAARRWGQ